MGDSAPDRLLILETDQAKVKRNSVHESAVDACIFNEFRGLWTFASG